MQRMEQARTMMLGVGLPALRRWVVDRAVDFKIVLCGQGSGPWDSSLQTGQWMLKMFFFVHALWDCSMRTGRWTMGLSFADRVSGC